MTAFTKTIALTTALAATLTLGACQSTSSSPVIQRADATYETTGIGATKIKAQQNAVDSANKACRNKQVIVLKDKTTFNGILNERTDRMVGQMGAIVGSVLGTDSQAPKLSRDDDYEYTINFRCQ